MAGGPPDLYAWQGDLEIVRRLVARGDGITARDDDKDHTVLDWARAGGHQPVIDYLVSIGAPESERWTTK
jgi:ankyrin repeat protein